jgi:integrase
MNRLTARTVATLREPGLFRDGQGLALRVNAGDGKSWVFLYREKNGRQVELGIGSARDLTLAEAREKAAELRKLRLAGIDPLERRKDEKAKARIDAARGMSFEQCAGAYIEAHKAGWRNAKHADQWQATLAAYAFPIFGKLPVAAVDTTLVMKALEPIWREKPETATRVRGRIESILDWAAVRGFRQGDNPARWRGHLDHLLPARSKVAKVEHHAALPFAEMAAFMIDLRSREGVGARALEFVILTAARSGEVRGATWGEIDIDARVWTVPGERMKAGREHRVPLSDPALAILAAMRLPGAVPDALIFPGAKAGSPLSDMSLTAVLRRMSRGDFTAHGFRSTFRDWAAEETSFPREVAEAALAHTIKDRVEAAYRRGDALEKRRALMTAWAVYCEPPCAPGCEARDEERDES